MLALHPLTLFFTIQTMILANESLLISIAFLGIASLVVFAIGNNYDGVIESINTVGNLKNAKIAESIDVMDVQKDGHTSYIILSNRSDRAVKFTDFWDEQGDNITCFDSNGTLEELEMSAHLTVTISCIVNGTSDVILLSENYNIIRIGT